MALGLTLFWIVLGAAQVRGNGDDWKLFSDAGRHVGNIALLTEAHFVYTPAAAWALWPFAKLSPATGYYIYVALMVLFAASAAVVAARLYRIPAALATLMALAWFPFTVAILLGQNSPVALLLSTLAIFGIAKRRDLLAGLCIGLLLYKPNDAIPFVFLLSILRQWRPLAVVACSLPFWYLLSSTATHDWLWPQTFSHTLSTWYRYDAGIDAVFSINVPGLLLNFGVPSRIAVGVGIAAFLATTPLLLRVSRLEAASVVPLIGIACSPHAYGYEALLALPSLWLLVSKPNGVRVAGVACAYCIAPFYYFSRAVHFDALAIPVLAGLTIWIAIQLRATKTPHTPIAN